MQTSRHHTSSDSIADFTRARFPELARGDLAVSNAGQDGSDRQYFRVRAGSLDENRSIVVMQYGTERVENEAFVPLTEFLEEIGVACPSLLSHQEDERLVWLQDLGLHDLSSHNNNDWETVRRPYYKAALREVIKIHQFNENELIKNSPVLVDRLEPHFDASMYRWEQEYFFKNFATTLSTANEETVRAASQHPLLVKLTDELARYPRTLIHRDFQSRNIKVRDGNVYLIDYQGMRFGLPEYDLASLVYDPYVSLSPQQRECLISFYLDLLHDSATPHLTTTEDDFRDRLAKCAIQRLMQALGAYGFLTYQKHKSHFLESVEPAVANLREVIAGHNPFAFLLPILELKDPLPQPS
jgi:aminoglycoside/choline kinase family phosphotransferase